MRIGLLVEQLLSPVPGGTGRFSQQLAAALARTAATGDDVESWTAWHRNTVAAEITGVRGPRRLGLPRRPLIAAWQRRRGPGPRGAQLVHAPTLLVPPPRVPTVVTIHDAVPWTHPDTLTPRGVAWHRSMAAAVVGEGATIAVHTRGRRRRARRVPAPVSAAGRSTCSGPA